MTVKEFKSQKKETITTPLHLACQMSNTEAVRILLTKHDYDVNILLYEQNFLYDLLQKAELDDFKILTQVFKDRKPCVNSGKKIPLIKAILQGNQFIIQTLLQYGEPNPYARDENGVTPLHAACAKLDWETFEDLVDLGGDPMLPDKDGNTFLHLLCQGRISDKEFDFAKLAIQKFCLKLTRNRQGKTPLNILRAMDAQRNLHRRQPNYAGHVIDLLEREFERDEAFEDH